MLFCHQVVVSLFLDSYSLHCLLRAIEVTKKRVLSPLKDFVRKILHVVERFCQKILAKDFSERYRRLK